MKDLEQRLQDAITTIQEVCVEFKVRATLDMWPIDDKVYRLQFGKEEDLN